MKIERAYLHHYKKFGVDYDQIDEAFMKCEETLEAYKQLWFYLNKKNINQHKNTSVYKS